MKKVLIFALAAGMLTACSQEETLETQAPTQISFAGAFVENVTRAAADPSTTTASIANFDVWGFMDQPSGMVFNREKVTGSQEAGWSYANTQYWTPNHTYYFAAVSPAASNNINVNNAYATTDGLGVITFDNIDGTEDLLYAAVKYDALANAEEITTQPDPVKFTFNHMLSKVKFTFKNAFANDNASLKITDIEMTAPSGAQINVAQADWWSTNQWQIPAGCENGRTLKFGDLESNNLAAGKSLESANERLTIPAGETQKYVVKFHVELYQGDVLAIEGDRTAEITGVALEIGKAYNFTAELNASNLTDDVTENPLFPITFAVEEVKDWDYTPGDVVAAQHCDTEEELLAAVKEDGEVILDADIALEKTLLITKNTTLNLNGKKLSINNDSEELGVGDGIIATAGNLVIEGEGTVEANTRAVWARGDGSAKITINGGTYVGSKKGCEVIYASGNGQITINSGTFEAKVQDEKSFAAPQYAVLNLYSNGKSGCNIVVYGGTFKNFNPSDNISENPKKDFVAPGYESVETVEGSSIWTVKQITE